MIRPSHGALASLVLLAKWPGELTNATDVFDANPEAKEHLNPTFIRETNPTNPFESILQEDDMASVGFTTVKMNDHRMENEVLDFGALDGVTTIEEDTEVFTDEYMEITLRSGSTVGYGGVAGYVEGEKNPQYHNTEIMEGTKGEQTPSLRGPNHFLEVISDAEHKGPRSMSVLEIGRWKLAQMDGKHFSISSHDKSSVPMIFKTDGDSQGVEPRCGEMDHCALHLHGCPLFNKYVYCVSAGSSGSDPGCHPISESFSCPVGFSSRCRIDSDCYDEMNDKHEFNAHDNSPVHKGSPRFGDKMVQIGDWRIAQITYKGVSHLSVGHKNLNVARIYRDDGGVVSVNEKHFNGWNWGRGKENCAFLSSNGFLQLGDWRIGEESRYDVSRLSVGNRNGNVARIYQQDGSILGNVRFGNTWDVAIGRILAGTDKGCG